MGCNCHINPPCSYCMEKVECQLCGKLVHPDETYSLQRTADDVCEPVCGKCYDKWVEG